MCTNFRKKKKETASRLKKTPLILYRADNFEVKLLHLYFQDAGKPGSWNIWDNLTCFGDAIELTVHSQCYWLQKHEKFQAVQGGTQLHSILLFEGIWTVQKHRRSLVRESRNVTLLTTGSVAGWVLWPCILPVPHSRCNCTRWVGCI